MSELVLVFALVSPPADVPRPELPPGAAAGLGAFLRPPEAWEDLPPDQRRAMRTLGRRLEENRGDLEVRADALLEFAKAVRPAPIAHDRPALRGGGPRRLAPRPGRGSVRAVRGSPPGPADGRGSPDQRRRGPPRGRKPGGLPEVAQAAGCRGPGEAGHLERDLRPGTRGGRAGSGGGRRRGRPGVPREHPARRRRRPVASVPRERFGPRHDVADGPAPVRGFERFARGRRRPGGRPPDRGDRPGRDRCRRRRARPGPLRIGPEVFPRLGGSALERLEWLREDAAGRGDGRAAERYDLRILEHPEADPSPPVGGGRPARRGIPPAAAAGPPGPVPDPAFAPGPPPAAGGSGGN